MKHQRVDKPMGYKIGAVSRLTGITPETLRIWERRYDLLTPQRTSSGDRLFDADDIDRLRLIKQLLDHGDRIGSIASLPLETLRARADEMLTATNLSIDANNALPLRLVTVGEALSARFDEALDTANRVELIKCFRDPVEFEQDVKKTEADILIIDQPTLQTGNISQIVHWLSRSAINRAVIIYRFTSDETLGEIPSSKCSTLRAPVDTPTLIEHCLALRGTAIPVKPGNLPDMKTTLPAPPRRFDDRSLARLASISSTVKCECPRHLAELITSLCAFEQYSFQCESSSPRDAALHAYLNNTASHARHMIEDALELVIDAENLAF